MDSIQWKARPLDIFVLSEGHQASPQSKKKQRLSKSRGNVFS